MDRFIMDDNNNNESTSTINNNSNNNNNNSNKPLSILEKKFLLAVERGDLPAVKRFIKQSSSSSCQEKFNINCCDPLGRSGLLMAIDNENLEMIELLLASGVEMKDALLHAINEEFVEAVELLLDHENLIHVPGTPHSWEAFERETFTNDITPLVLAAHRNNYEIIKIILDRNISPIPMPHNARCGCKECCLANKEDCLRHSRSRINAYKALSSPSLIALYSKDPILTAFELSWQLRRLSFLEPEFKNEYFELRKQCQLFATALLDHTRTTEELEILLNYDPNDGDLFENHERMQLTRLKLAINNKQKMFCSHPNVQQLLASIWYEGLPGFRRKNIVLQIFQLIGIGILFPFLSMAYIIAPYSRLGRFIKKPFIKFICHSASYITFLVLLILASQRIESSNIFGINPIENNNTNVNNTSTTTKRGSLPSYIELCIMAWVFGLIWSEIKQLWDLGITEYLSDMWNILDFINNSIYVATITLRVIAYKQTQKEIMNGENIIAYQRENWHDFDPILLSEGLFATANIFSSLKLVYIFSVNPYLGPLQISLGRMVIDILKFFSIYLLVLFSFACGMNQLLWYYADMEKQSCLIQQIKANPNNNNDPNDQLMLQIKQQQQSSVIELLHPNACFTWRRFANLFESTQTLFWATFGLIDLDIFELTGIKSYTRFWGLLMFGVYCIINVAVLLNLLIAMMNHSYQIISEQSDIEWKFARSKLWMSYFSDGSTVPPPFNIIPTPKSLSHLFRYLSNLFLGRTKKAKTEAMRTIKRKQMKANERDFKYYRVVRALIRRYVMNEQRIQERQRGVTEDDCNEIKQEIGSLRYDLLEMLGQRKRETQNTASGSYLSGKKSRQRERRLMKGFNFDSIMEDHITGTGNTASFDEDVDLNSKDITQTPSTSMKNILKNKFYRTTHNMQWKTNSNAWKTLMENTMLANTANIGRRNKMLRTQDSMESDCTIPGDNTDGSMNSGHFLNQQISNNDLDLDSSSIDNNNQANIKRRIFAMKLDSMSLSQPILSSSSNRQIQQPTVDQSCVAKINGDNDDRAAGDCGESSQKIEHWI